MHFDLFAVSVEKTHQAKRAQHEKSKSRRNLTSVGRVEPNEVNKFKARTGVGTPRTVQNGIV